MEVTKQIQWSKYILAKLNQLECWRSFTGVFAVSLPIVMIAASVKTSGYQQDATHVLMNIWRLKTYICQLCWVAVLYLTRLQSVMSHQLLAPQVLDTIVLNGTVIRNRRKKICASLEKSSKTDGSGR